LNDSSTYFDWWTSDLSFRSGWIEYAFEKAVTVTGSELYWFDDTGRGGVRVPASWRLLYRDDGAWRPVEATSPTAWSATSTTSSHSGPWRPRACAWR
jgi:hypothetical protein